MSNYEKLNDTSVDKTSFMNDTTKISGQDVENPSEISQDKQKYLDGDYDPENILDDQFNEAEIAVSSDWNIVKYTLILSGEIFVVLMIESLRDDVVFAFIRTREVDITEAFSSLCLIFDIFKTALPFAFTQGFGFLACKNYSMGDYKALGKNANKMYFLLICAAIPTQIIFVFGLGPLYKSFIENPLTSYNLEKMFQWLAIGVPFSFVKFGSMRYLNSVQKGHIATLSSFTGLMVQVVFLLIFITHMEIINFGISMSINIGMIVNCLMQHIYIWVWNPVPESTKIDFWPGLTRHMWWFIKYNLVMGGIVYLSIFSFDVITYLGVMLGDQDYTIINIMAIKLMIIFLISDGITASSNILINYCVGLKKWSTSLRVFLYTMLLNLFYCVFMVLIFSFGYETIFMYFTANNALNYIAATEKTLFIVLMVFTILHSMFAETLSAIGGECVSLITTTFLRLVLAIFLGIIFVEYAGMGIGGILVGMIIGQCLCMIVNGIYLYIYFKDDGIVYQQLLTHQMEEDEKEIEELDYNYLKEDEIKIEEMQKELAHKLEEVNSVKTKFGIPLDQKYDENIHKSHY
jgi:Na+-driven multidrug efflux pump